MRMGLPLLLLAAALAAPGFAQGPAPDDDEDGSSVSVEPAEGVEAAPPPARRRAAPAPAAGPADESEESPPPARSRGVRRQGKKKVLAAPGLIYGKEMNGKKVTVRPGQVFVVQLAGEPAGGAAWVLSRLDGIALDPVGDVEFHPDKVKPGMPRTGMFAAGFRAMKPGPALIEMEYRRFGERLAAAALFSLKVDVLKPPKAKAKGKSKLRPIPGEEEGSGDAETPPEDKPAEGEDESSSEEPVGD